jgi:dihydrofolate synthase/folylpolyglutamate synthase
MTAQPYDPVQWLYDLQHSGMKLGLDNIRQALDVMGRPEESFTPVLIGGTNGKGSVTAMLDAMLRACGVRSGMFTSPHLVRVNERIRIDGRDIPTDELHRRLDTVRNFMEEGIAAGRIAVQPSFFETMTATAILALHKSKVQVGLLEVGLGGRLDATNAVAAALSVIVSIDYDHTKNLGPTLEDIAGEKAGIIKEGMPLVCAVRRKAPRDVLVKIAAERNAPYLDVMERSELGEKPGGVRTIRTGNGNYTGLRLALHGNHQWHNARTAVVALEQLAGIIGFRIDPDAVAQGLASTRWDGRLQSIPGKPDMLLDGAHNPAGVAALTDYMKKHHAGERPVLLFGATREKDLNQVLAPLAPYVSGLVATRPDINRAMEPEVIRDYGTGRFEPVLLHHEPQDAVAAARELAGPDGLVLVAGSLYLVGCILAVLEEEPCREESR